MLRWYCLAVALMSFVLHGWSRTMFEVLGGDWEMGLVSFGLSSMLGYLPVVCFLLPMYWAGKLKHAGPYLLVWLALSLAGSTASELAIQWDESRFLAHVRELEQGQIEDSYSRDRMWPNGATHLLWSRTRGVWAID
ncbi:MAG: hypothetical protein P1V35_15310 [Planctomycetota bacterium]|nr:hypothetical protein [Planctomycetota bacterium]